MEKEKSKKKFLSFKTAHIIIIILGTIFILLGAFHEDIWFDESYSVAIANHSFSEIWQITGNDVHPPLYYWMLHILELIFGSNITIYRVFSTLAIAIVGILGYTYIRKDFGKNVGLLFSFLTFFLPVMSTYSQEIRMYSWACLFVTVMSIYGYRLYKNIKEKGQKLTEEENKKFKKVQLKNLIIFGIFSVCSMYTHYYSLMTAFVINLALLIFLIKNRKENKNTLRNFIILGIIQVALYIPWLYYLIIQMLHVGGGFWITLGLNTAIEVISFQFMRQLNTGLNIETITALIASILTYIYIIARIIKSKKENKSIKPGIIALILYITIILIMLAISLISPILYARYLLVITGIYIFFLSFFMATEKRKVITFIICVIITILGTISNIKTINTNYDESNMKQIEYLRENIKEDDIIIYKNVFNGGVIAALFPENKQYFYNSEYWNVEEAYKAFGPGMEIIYSYMDVLENYQGRIWLIDTENLELYQEFPKEGITVLEGPTKFNTKYQNYTYNIILLEKQ